MYVVMDMGTTNARLFLVENGRVIGKKKGAFGAGVTKKKGREFLLRSVKDALCELCSDNAVMLGLTEIKRYLEKVD